MRGEQALAANVEPGASSRGSPKTTLPPLSPQSYSDHSRRCLKRVVGCLEMASDRQLDAITP
jgi:hypothetical protein